MLRYLLRAHPCIHSTAQRSRDAQRDDSRSLPAEIQGATARYEASASHPTWCASGSARRSRLATYKGRTRNALHKARVRACGTWTTTSTETQPSKPKVRRRSKALRRTVLRAESKRGEPCITLEAARCTTTTHFFSVACRSKSCARASGRCRPVLGQHSDHWHHAH